MMIGYSRGKIKHPSSSLEVVRFRSRTRGSTIKGSVMEKGGVYNVR